MEIFSLLPLEKLNLDKVKPDKSKKKEEEENHRYRLIPRTFPNSAIWTPLVRLSECLGTWRGVVAL